MPNKKETFIFVAKKLSGTKIKWAFIGSSNMELQGMDVVPNDIDILVDFLDRKIVDALFLEEDVISDLKLRNGEGEEITFLILGTEVQFCFEYPHGFYSQFLRNNKFFKVKLGSVEIPCNLLENEIKAYEYLGRKEKAEKVRAFLKK
ncbi:MAG: hypothetical protein WCF93_03915 [Candidatus Moraniibacteriota bacterium]